MRWCESRRKGERRRERVSWGERKSRREGWRMREGGCECVRRCIGISRRERVGGRKGVGRRRRNARRGGWNDCESSR